MNAKVCYRTKTYHKRLFIISLLLSAFPVLCALSSIAQKVESIGKTSQNQVVSAEYSRSSLTFIMLEPGRMPFQGRLRSTMEDLEVPDKFNDNNISRRSLEIGRFERDNIMLFAQQSQNRQIVAGSGLDEIRKSLESERIANHVLAKWWSRKPDGTFGVELLQERGAYDATDAEVVAARAAKRGMARVMDAGEELINKSYILVFDFHDTKTMAQHYNEVDSRRRETAKRLNTTFTPVERTREGYRTDLAVHLFRIDFNDSVSAVFFQELWIDPATDDEQTQALKKKKFDEFHFPISYVTSVSTTQESSQLIELKYGKKSDEELFTKLVEGSMDDVLFQLSTRYEDFRVRTAVYNTRPIRAKIGLKEGVSVDQRYFVYEYRLDARGEIYSVRRGVVRATNKITDNRQVATGETQPSRFYQIAGRRIEPGMLLEQKNDFGLGLSFGYGIEEEIIGSGLWLMLELNVSQTLGRSGSKPAPGIKLFADMSFDGIDNPDLDMSLLSVSLGLSKDLHIMRNVQLIPFAGFGFENVSAKEEGEIKISGNGEVTIKENDAILYTIFGSAGLRLGINLRHNVQLLGSATYILGNYDSYEISKEELEDKDLILPMELQNRAGGLQPRIGLRIQF